MPESLLHTEILQQPGVIERLLTTEIDNVQQICQQFLGRFKYIQIAARGTSDNAARYAQYLFQIKNHIPVSLATPSVFSVYQQPPVMDEALVIAISQSGMSPDIISVVEEAARQRRPTLVLTNDTSSPLAQAAEAVIPLHAGAERAVAATKTYTASLAAVALLSYAMAGDPSMLDEMLKLPSWINETLVNTLALTSRMERYTFVERGVVIGRGFNYSTAFEVALKIKELTGITTVPYSSADFMHGPIASVHQGYPVIAITSHGVVHADILELIGKVRQLDADLVVISDDPAACALAQFAMPTPQGMPEWLSPVVNIIPGQILGWQIAMHKGLNPDQPKGLSKITETV